jgi:hypothetical protein
MARSRHVRVLAVGLAVVLLASLGAPAPALAFDPITLVTLAGFAIEGIVAIATTVGFLAVANSRDGKMPSTMNYGGTTLQCVGAEITPTNCRIVVTPKSEYQAPETPAVSAEPSAPQS